MKTIEEAAREYSCGDGLELSFKAGVDFAQRWYSVDEQLPENNVPVLIKNELGFYGVGELRENKWRFFTVESYAEMINLKQHTWDEVIKVTHFRYIELK